MKFAEKLMTKSHIIIPTISVKNEANNSAQAL
jgi:hypothetical protein